MSKTSSSRAKIFNINRESKRYYPSLKIVEPSRAGVPAYHPTKVHTMAVGESGKSPICLVYKQAA